ncbi:MAG: quinone-dependent dihydroorotate dehydrogenase [Rhodothermales bacterium]
MYELFRPLLFRLEAERAHRLSMGAARLAQRVNPPFLSSMFDFGHGALGQTLWGRNFPNPVGLAAGFDKNARLVRFWEKIGFGFVEVGSVTACAAKGNKRPRAFRLPADRAIINRMGLNNQGAEKIARRIHGLGGKRTMPLGINLAKTHDPTLVGDAAIEDFRRSFQLLAPLADYIALNISCPNTAEGKTFEEPEALDALLAVIFAERKELRLGVPVLVKLAPPLTPKVIFDSLVEELIDVAMAHGVHGFIATNTASDRQGLTTPEDVLQRIGRGGLSGVPLAQRSTQLVRYLYRRIRGAVPIIGVGGIDSAEAAYTKLRAGASLVQLYTGLVYEGPSLVRHIKEGLVRLFEEDGVASIREVVGLDA